MERNARERALVIDDNQAALLATSSLLENLGFDVQEADGSTAALRAIERERFALVVSDINMPGDMNGIQLAQILRQRHTRIPIILMTGYRENLDASANEFIILSKPFGSTDLKDAIRSATTA